MRSRDYAYRPMTVPPPGAEAKPGPGRGMSMPMPVPQQYQQQQQAPRRAPTLAADVMSPTSTHISQYDLVSAPGTGSQGRRPSVTMRSDWGPDRSHTASVLDSLMSSRGKTPRSDREREKERERESERMRESRQADSLVENWRVDPDVVSTTTPASLYQPSLAQYSSEAPHVQQYASQPHQGQEQSYPPAPRAQDTPYQQQTYASASTSSRQTAPMPPYPSGPPRPRQVVMPEPLANRTMSTDNVPPSARPPLPPIAIPQKKRSPLDYFRKKRPRMPSMNSVPNIIVESPSESASSNTGETQQPELLTPESAHNHAPLPSVERLETEPAQTREPSPNPSPLSGVPQLPSGFDTFDQRQQQPPSHAQAQKQPYPPSRTQIQTQPQSQSQDPNQTQLMRPPTRSSSRASGRQHRSYAYESAPMPSGVMYPGPPSRQMPTQKGGGKGDKGGLAVDPPRHPTQSVSPAPLNRPISLFNEP
ncbi:hypothetical protein CONPUDRAFT_135388 [Coniophora puteana RWD-64-598 SS2]|uniref:Uncharacterized protein n=1 Tax=Coniophora puteana (strain RWD-64-598) TaxID=741705 RepID=A0A5M3N4A0_CONPW|nr:uncharacterized protein CONPUDRAFT_135388 [Coniophora puteana RWD-64-598 SS2]EIW85864.1 hypothetical protein CONPUDRAFT_135388 [Coniophora puteana RWD-64-598 SS2]